MDTVIGCVLQVVIAVFIILIGAALFGCIPDIENAGPSELNRSITGEIRLCACNAVWNWTI